MKNNYEKYDFYADLTEGEYGLYVMEIQCEIHSPSHYLAYDFDGDKFISIDKDERNKFSGRSSLEYCKDEYGNEYRGNALDERIKEAVNSYREEFPGYLEYHNETSELLDGLE